jgi:hypothetical protein
MNTSKTKRMTLIGASLLTAVLAGGCTESTGLDQCQRREIFQQCMKLLPAGPQVTKYNDWDEVVRQCDAIAYHQSLKKKTQIAAECGL